MSFANHFPETVSAWKRLRFNILIYLSDRLWNAAMRIDPKPRWFEAGTADENGIQIATE